MSYSISKNTGVCASTGEPIEPGDIYYAVLVDPEPTEDDKGEPGLERVDVSLAAWEQGFRPPRAFGFWKATAAEPNEKKGLKLDAAALTSLLASTDDNEDEQRESLRYVVALMLMRKRMLRFDGTEREKTDDGDEHETWLLTPKLDPTKGPLSKWSDEATLRVVDPKLTEDQIAAVADQLGDLVEIEL